MRSSILLTAVQIKSGATVAILEGSDFMTIIVRAPQQGPWKVHDLPSQRGFLVNTGDRLVSLVQSSPAPSDGDGRFSWLSAKRTQTT